MFSALVEFGTVLEAEQKLPPAGFYYYGAPIRWTVHLWPDRLVLEPSALDWARPSSGRTSGIEAHLLVDEAGYSLGVTTDDKGGIDARARQKHETHPLSFRNLYRDFLASPELSDPALREAIGWLDQALTEEWVKQDPKFQSLLSKDWVTFVPEEGPLREQHLFQHPDAKAFWVKEMARRAARISGDPPGEVQGYCSVCGKGSQTLLKKLPLQVKLAGQTPLHSLNADAFTSFVSGSDTKSRAHIGLCFVCADTAARSFNYLSDSERHRVQLARHPKMRDALTNQYALFWIHAPSPIVIDGQEIDLGETVAMDWTLPLTDIELMPEATLNQMRALLKQPWIPKEQHFRIDDFAFYLALLSPNVGRIAVRDWLPISIERLKTSLAVFFEATLMVTSYGERLSPVSIGTLIQAIDAESPDLNRALIRTAYTGTPPPGSLAFRAGQRLNHLNALEHSLQERQRSRRRDQPPVWNARWPQALAAAVKLGSFYQRKEMESMSEVNKDYASRAYQCGRLLAALEEAQQIYTYHQSGSRLDVSIVQRAYGGACATPAPVFGRLFRLASMAHLPEAGGWVNQEVESISSRLIELGGIPNTLTLNEQADFGLGFYQERALIRSRRTSNAG